eukprot:496188-Rhodomonas_salina.1
MVAMSGTALTLEVNFHLATEFRWQTLADSQAKIAAWVRRKNLVQREPGSGEWSEVMMLVNRANVMLDPCRAAAYRIEEWMEREGAKGKRGMLRFIHEAISSIRDFAPHPQGLITALEYSKVVLAAAVLVSSFLNQTYIAGGAGGFFQRFWQTHAGREYESIADFKLECRRTIMET